MSFQDVLGFGGFHKESATHHHRHPATRRSTSTTKTTTPRQRSGGSSNHERMSFASNPSTTCQRTQDRRVNPSHADRSATPSGASDVGELPSLSRKGKPSTARAPLILHGRILLGRKGSESSGSTSTPTQHPPSSSEEEEEEGKIPPIRIKRQNQQRQSAASTYHHGGMTRTPKQYPEKNRHHSGGIDDTTNCSTGAGGAPVTAMRRKYMELRRKVNEARHVKSEAAQQRRSTWRELHNEVCLFQKLVADLESVIASSGESPDRAWRAKIMMRSAEDTDKDLWHRLYEYETTLLPVVAAADGTNDPQQELRRAHTACTKLHRDFRRSHKVLVATLNQYKIQQRAEISTLSAVDFGATAGPGQPAIVTPSNGGAAGDCQTPTTTTTAQNDDDSFFERAMRARDDELNQVNKSMHKVNEIYQELATLVDNQQDRIDQLEENVDCSKANVDAGAEHIGCIADKYRLCSPQSNESVTSSRVAGLRGCGPGVTATMSDLDNVNAREKLCGAMDHVNEGWNALESSLEKIGGQLRKVEIHQQQQQEQQRRAARGAEKTASSRHGNAHSPSTADDGVRVSERFHWSMPLETFKEDMNAVSEDIVGLGKELIKQGKMSGLACGADSATAGFN